MLLQYKWCQPFSGLYTWAARTSFIVATLTQIGPWSIDWQRHTDLSTYMFFFCFLFFSYFAHRGTTCNTPPVYTKVRCGYCMCKLAHTHPSIHMYMSHMHICKLLTMHKSCQEICDMCARTITCSLYPCPDINIYIHKSQVTSKQHSTRQLED